MIIADNYLKYPSTIVRIKNRMYVYLLDNKFKLYRTEIDWQTGKDKNEIHIPKKKTTYCLIPHNHAEVFQELYTVAALRDPTKRVQVSDLEIPFSPEKYLRVMRSNSIYIPKRYRDMLKGEWCIVQGNYNRIAIFPDGDNIYPDAKHVKIQDRGARGTFIIIPDKIYKRHNWYNCLYEMKKGEGFLVIEKEKLEL